MTFFDDFYVIGPNLSFPRRFINVTMYCFVLRCQYYFSHLLGMIKFLYTFSSFYLNFHS